MNKINLHESVYMVIYLEYRIMYFDCEAWQLAFYYTFFILPSPISTQAFKHYEQ